MSERLQAPVDLHTHTTYSDGELTPNQLIDYAAERGIAAISITDHDTVAAYTEPDLYDYAENAGLEIVAGVEISTADNKNRFHVLGLCINAGDPQLLDWLESLQDSRRRYTADVISALEAQGWQVSHDLLLEEYVHTKAHVAEAVVRDAANSEKLQSIFGDVPTRGQFIETYMNPGQTCFVPRQSPTPDEAIQNIHAAGGLAFLAHPVAYKYEQEMTDSEIVRVLRRSDYDGIEAMYYYYHKSNGDVEIDEVANFMQIARRQKLIVSGGSDFHGASPIVGNYMDIGYGEKAAYPTVETLRSIQRAAEARRAVR